MSPRKNGSRRSREDEEEEEDDDDDDDDDAADDRGRVRGGLRWREAERHLVLAYPSRSCRGVSPTYHIYIR